MEPERSTGSTKCPALGPCPASFWARVRGLAGLHLLQLNTDMLCSVDSITTGKGLVSCVCSSVLNGTDIRCMGKVTCAGNCLLQKNVADAQIRCPEKHSGAAQRAVSVNSGKYPLQRVFLCTFNFFCLHSILRTNPLFPCVSCFTETGVEEVSVPTVSVSCVMGASAGARACGV